MVNSLPYVLRLTVFLSIMTEHTMSFMLPTIIVYYLESLFMSSGEANPSLEDVSYHVGILEGLYGLFAILSGTFWGLVSDKIGRKNSLILILSGVSLSSIGLGLASNFKLAIFWRIIAGCFSGLIPTTKALMRDVSDDSNISILYSYFGAGYGAASIFGPLLGGFLSKPNCNFSENFRFQLLSDFPYFLPLFIHALFSFSTMILVILAVPSSSKTVKPVKKNFKFITSKEYLGSIIVLFLCIFVQYEFRTLLSLWLRLDKDKGGMGWNDSEKPGIMNMLSGVISMVLPLFLTNILKQKLGIRMACLLLSILIILPNTFVPFTVHLPEEAVWASLIICNGLFIAFCTIFLSVISIALSNTVNSDMAGIAIGISQSVVSGSRALSTSGTALLFGYLQEFTLPFPFDSHFLFLLNIVFSFFTIFSILYLLNPRVEKRRLSINEEPLLKDIDRDSNL